MRLIILQFEVAPFLDEYENKFGELPEGCEINDFAIMVMLSIMHRHCILMLTDSAFRRYEERGVCFRNKVDDIVENLVFNPDDSTVYHIAEYYRTFRGVLSISKVRLRRKRTFEVYCE